MGIFKFNQIKFDIWQSFCISLYYNFKTNIMKDQEKVMNPIDEGSASELINAYSNLILINHMWAQYRARMIETEIFSSTVDELIDNAKRYLRILKIKSNKTIAIETEKTLSTLNNFGYGN